MSLEQQIEQGPVNHKVISKAVNRSQHTQRNFDLSKTIPDSDLKELLHSMTECPSKNNIAFYGVHMINSQILANLVVIFEALPINLEMFENEPEGYVPPNGFRNAEHYLMKNPQHSNETITSSEIVPHKTSDEAMAALKTDQATAIGIAAGYLNLTAAMLGYRTGCCSCFNSDAVKQVANLEHGAFLLMGVGFHNNEKNRREHQTDDFTFHTMRKQPVPVKWRV